MTYIPSPELLAATAGASYPPAEYGLITTSTPLESCWQSSALSSWAVRMLLPAGKSVSAAAVAITATGTLAGGGLNALAVYSDDGATQLGVTATDNSLYTTAGWATSSLVTPIVAASANRFVWVLVAVNGYSGAPSTAFSVLPGASSDVVVNGGAGKPNHRRSMFGSIAAFPVPFVPGSFGTRTGFIPLVGLG